MEGLTWLSLLCLKPLTPNGKSQGNAISSPYVKSKMLTGWWVELETLITHEALSIGVFTSKGVKEEKLKLLYKWDDDSYPFNKSLDLDEKVCQYFVQVWFPYTVGCFL